MTRTKPTSKRTYKHLFTIIVTALLIGFIAGLTLSNKNVQGFLARNFAVSQEVIVRSDPILVGSSEIELCFTPPAGCGKVISNLISKASKSIYVQAYSITSNEIVSALIAAHNRGVKVRILLDKSNLAGKYSKMRILKKSGISVWIDYMPSIAHNKVIIIDQRIVITGSFNFTKSADHSNAENVIIVHDKQVANRYLRNWLARRSNNQ